MTYINTSAPQCSCMNVHESATYLCTLCVLWYTASLDLYRLIHITSLQPGHVSVCPTTGHLYITPADYSYLSNTCLTHAHSATVHWQ